MRHPLNKGQKVPLVFTKCLELIRMEGTTTEGIFRIGGSKPEKEDLKRLWNRGGQFEPGQQFSIGVITDLIKDFIRNIPNNLCLTSVFGPLRDTGISQLNPGDYTTLVYKLPEYNRNMIIELVKVLQFLLKYQETTKMTADNYSICLSPNLFENGLFSLDTERIITVNIITHLNVKDFN